MSILDRYVIRQVLMPFVLGLLVFTFLLIIPGMMRYAEPFVAKGASFAVVGQVMWTLVPGALALTIPMSFLLALLVGFGRLSADREFVALQACGVSLARLLRPVSLVAVISAGTTAYMWIVGMPAGNYRFQEITLNVTASLAEGEVKPRAFFTAFPDLLLYVEDVPRTGGWEGVFLADSRGAETPAVYLARQGRVIINQERQTVELVLEDGVRYSGDGTYDVYKFGRTVFGLDPARIFPRFGVSKGDREKSIAELRQTAADLQETGQSPHNPLFEIQVKYAIPASCLIFGLIGLALGATNRRDGAIASFVVGVVVVFVYYVLLEAGRGLNKGQIVPPAAAAWMANAVLGVLGVGLLLARRRVADRALRIPTPAFVRAFASRRRTLVRHRLPVRILDRYVTGTYLRVLGLAMLGLASAFYITTFIEQSERVFKGEASWGMFGAYLWHLTPQYASYIIPLGVLLATLVTVALLTKSSELIVMKACGISLYRVTLPMIVAAVVAGGSLFAIEQTVLGPSNRQAERLRLQMRQQPTDGIDLSTRRAVMGRDGAIYLFNYFEPRTRTFTRLSVLEFSPDRRRLTRRTFARTAVSRADPSTGDASWQLESGSTRELDEEGATAAYVTFDQTQRTLEPVSQFSTEPPIPEFMSYTQLRDYVERLDSGGFGVIAQRVALARKISFPFITLVMTLVAIPFAVTIGRSGALAGIGVGIAIAIVFWVTISVFGALGAGGAIPPQMAAWAPNLIFGAGAAYLLLTVRT